MASAETVVLTLQEQISGPAEAAAGGLSRLEQQILREQAALERLEQRLAGAQGKLAGLAEGKVDLRAEAAFLRQEAAVDRLEQKLASARGALASMGAANVSTDKLDAAERATARLEAQLANAKARLAEMGTPGGEVVNTAAYARAQAAVDQLSDAMAAKKDKVAEFSAQLKQSGTAAEGAAEKIEQVKNVADKQAKVAAAASGSMDKLGEASKRMMGETGEKLDKIKGFAQAVTSLGPIAIAAAAAFAIAMSALVALNAMFIKGIGAASEYRDELLKLAGATEGNMVAAKELQETISAVSSASATGREKIVDFAMQLSRAGLSGIELKNALEAAAIASSAGGDQMASDFLSSVEAAKKAGESVDELSKKMKDKLGGVAAAQALAFGVQIDKLKENLTGLFSGADIVPLLTALRALTSIFDQTTASGQAMRASIGAAIESMIGVILRAAIAMVKLYIAIKTTPAAWNLVKAVAVGVAGALGLLTVAMTVVAATAATLAAPFLVAANLIGAAINKIGAYASGVYQLITSPIKTAKAWLASVTWADIGMAIMDGLTMGLFSKAGALISAVKSIMGGAKSAAATAVDAHSPSRWFATLGGNMGEGAAIGLDGSAGRVEESAEGVGEAAKTGARAGTKAAGALVSDAASGSKGFAPTFSGCQFIGTTQREVEAMMRAVFEAEYLDAGATA